MKRVFICTHYEGAREKHKQLARIYCRMVWDKGFFPIAPRLYLAQYLDETNKKERYTTYNIGLQVIEECTELWVFGEVVSKIMREEIQRAAELNIPVKYFDKYGEAL